MPRYILIPLFLLMTGSIQAQQLTIVISGIRSEKGVLRLAFFDSQEAWEQEKPLIKRTVKKEDMLNGSLKVTLKDIPAGHYGIAVLDDENENDRMDYRMLLPREGCGFSNYIHSGMRKPAFDEFDFEFRASLYLKVVMTYFL
jgi:uncharacterized protein (DUF2141 family)